MFFERRMRISRRRLALFLGDAFCITVSLVLAVVLRMSPEHGWPYVERNLWVLVVSGLIFLLVFYAGGMYERHALTRRDASLLQPLLLAAISLTLIIVVLYARREFLIGRGVLFLAGLGVATSTWALRRLYRVATGYGFFSKNALIVGEGQAAEEVIKLLASTDDPGYRVFGIVSCARAKAGEFLAGVPILGHLDKLREFSAAYDIETVIVATTLAREHSVLRVLRPLRYLGIQFLDYAGLYEQLGREIPVEHIDDEWLMHAAMNSSRIHVLKIKRSMDLAVAVVGLILSAPVCLITAILIRLDSPGPVIFRQWRAGLEGRPYILMKFRTMKADAERESGAVWAGKFDARVTRVGRFLRKWRIDEIPQLVNVLRGEMSLAGPRPERPEFIDTLVSAIPFYRERLQVLPGITGWAQVNFPYAASVEDARRKLQYDLYYIKHMSFFLDGVILLRTFRTILEGIRYGEDIEPERDVIQPPLRVISGADAEARTKSA